MNVYLETNLWNALCDHPVDADTFMGSLGARGINLGFSDHCVTEMAKTFRGCGTAVAPTECNAALGQSDQSVVGNGDTMSVVAEIAQHMFGPAERPSGVDDPVVTANLSDRFSSPHSPLHSGSWGWAFLRDRPSCAERGIKFPWSQNA
jgi:hypothetical protein